jgi:uncharacterized protein (TIGR02284 family)
LPTETKLELNPSTIDGVRDLIRANCLSARTLTKAASGVDDEQIASLCIGLREQRRRHEGELKYYILINGETVHRNGSWLASLHHDWLSLRAILSRGKPQVILRQVEQQEAHVKHIYENVLRKTTGSAVNDVLVKQYRVLREGFQRIRQMRTQIGAL